MSTFRRLIGATLLTIAMVAAPISAQDAVTVRIKDIASIQGVRENQLVGIGLVTGLNGRGDSTNSRMTKTSISNLLKAFGIRTDPADIRSKNSALVTVTADVPASSVPGERLDIRVASMADARDLTGGVLIQTNLRAANGEVYAVGQGPVTTATGTSDASAVGTIPRGAIVEAAISSSLFQEESILLVLHNPDFTNAAGIASAIRGQFPDLITTATNASLVQIEFDANLISDAVEFVSLIEQIRVTPDSPARVVINESSGMIVLGGNVRIAPVGISYQNRQIRVRPASIYDTNEHMFVIDDGATVADFVLILKELGVSTDVVIGMIKLIDKAGALFGVLSVE